MGWMCRCGSWNTADSKKCEDCGSEKFLHNAEIVEKKKAVILDAIENLNEKGWPVTIGEIAEHVKMERHTVGKYVTLLRDEKSICIKCSGKLKLCKPKVLRCRHCGGAQ